MRALVYIAAGYLTASGLLAVACCVVRARDNAKVRAVRRQMRARVEAELERDRYDREFAEIVAHFKESA